MKNLWTCEPVVVLGFVEALLLLLVSFGIDIDMKQQAAVLLTCKAALTWLARSRVSPASPKCDTP